MDRYVANRNKNSKSVLEVSSKDLEAKNSKIESLTPYDIKVSYLKVYKLFLDTQRTNFEGTSVRIFIILAQYTSL